MLEVDRPKPAPAAVTERALKCLLVGSPLFFAQMIFNYILDLILCMDISFATYRVSILLRNEEGRVRPH